MYLAVILGLVALTNCSGAAAIPRVRVLALLQEHQTPSDAPAAGSAQEPAPSAQPDSPQQAPAEDQKSEPAKSEPAGPEPAGPEPARLEPGTPQTAPSPDATKPVQPGQPDASDNKTGTTPKAAAKKKTAPAQAGRSHHYHHAGKESGAEWRNRRFRDPTIARGKR